MKVSDEAPRRGPLDSTTSGFSAVSSNSRRSNLVSGSLVSLQQGAKFMWRKKWLIPVLHSQFWFSACFSLMAPFFPNLAQKRGIRQTTCGFIFSVFKLFMFIGSFSSEKLIDRFGPVPLYVAGLVGTFIFDVSIGSLYWVGDPDIFLGLAFPLAIAGGFLACSYSVSMYSMVTERFSEKPGLIIASMEFLWGIGNMVGTMAGGFLIEFWGFPFPFFALGVIMILLIPTIIRNGPLQPSKSMRDPIEEHSELKFRPRNSIASLGRQSGVSVMSSISSQPDQPVRYKYMILQPLFIIDMITVMFSWIVMSFNEPTLQTWLSGQFRLTDSGIGIVFCVQYACYASGALLSGFVSSFGHEEFLLFLGQVCTALAYLLIGPVPFINHEPSMSFIYLSQIFTGFGMAAQFVCGFAHALKISIKAGYPKNIKTSGVVASATFVFMVLGAIVTPPIASFVVEEFGYRQGTMFIFCPLAAWSVVNFGVFIYGLKDLVSRSPDSDEAFA
ncbi:MFS-type transporter SLC18B1 [Galendromus occidentalis]|uniref:MFS-type transporter SLC18B1 n=1 Tax=Galendromus occidentalis TaxID=34638 RepID=A0AAJ7WIM8_9ACAR|nr:MFS-type transporter SLC18B1 [Galendromus occidentalis]